MLKIAFALAALVVVSAAFGEVPRLPSAVAQQSVRQRWVVNGVELQVTAIRSRRPVDALLAAWRQVMGRDEAEVPPTHVGAWSVVGLRDGDSFVTLQLRERAFGSDGFIVRAPFAARRSVPAAPCALPAGAEIVRTVESSEIAISTHFMIRWNRSDDPTRAVLRACELAGWSRQLPLDARSLPPRAAEGGSLEFLHREGATLDLMTQSVAGVPWIVMHEVRDP